MFWSVKDRVVGDDFTEVDGCRSCVGLSLVGNY